MTQFYHLDDSGDPGLEGQASSTSHYVLAMVQLAERAAIPVLGDLRQSLHLPATFEFKYHRTTAFQKNLFFESTRSLPFRVRAAVLYKSDLPDGFRSLTGQELTAQMISELTFRASPLDISNDILIVDGATPAFCRLLRIRFSEACNRSGRVRPFKRIIGGDSAREDGLQLADMVAGATRQHALGTPNPYYAMFAAKVVDLWQLSSK
jgi:hypothetical protein